MYKSINFTPIVSLKSLESVVISFHFSIFEPLETAFDGLRGPRK